MAASRSIEVKVGILILAAALLLAGFVLVMGGVNLQATYPIFVDFDNPGGLQAGAPVKVASVKIGRIEELQYRGGQADEKTGKRQPMVRLRVSIEKRYQQSVKENSVFYVTSQGVLGEQFLAVDPGTSDKPLSEGEVVRGIDPPRFDMLIAETYELLHAAVVILRDNKKELGETFDGLKKTVKGTGDFFDQNGKKLDRIVDNVEDLTKNGNDAVKGAKEKFVDNPKVDRILANTDQLTGTLARDTPPLLTDARAAIAGARKLTDGLSGDEEQKKVKQIVGDLADLTKSGKAIAGDAQAIVSQIKRGKGTVGAVVMDEQLYDDLKELVRDLKHNPWKFFWRE